MKASGSLDRRFADVRGILEAVRYFGKKPFVVLGQSSYLAELTKVEAIATDRQACCHCRRGDEEVAKSVRVQDEDFPISLVGATLLFDSMWRIEIERKKLISKNCCNRCNCDNEELIIPHSIIQLS